MFNPTRLKLARKRRALSKKKLESLISLSVQTLSDWENGKTIPKDDNLNELSKILNFPVEFFKGETLNELELNKVSFRALTKMDASTRDAVISSGRIAIYINSWIENKFSLPTNNLIHIKNETPEDAAKRIRKEWGITTTKLGNTIHLLEKYGVRVYSLVEESKHIDAFSVWDNGTPFVFLNTLKSPERSRFDAMHELGHLILHPNGIPRDKKFEAEANAFAAEMLMPSADILKLRSMYFNINNLITLKERWDVSLGALIYRLHTLGLISEWQNRSFIIELRTLGYDKNEPSSIKRETSYVLAKIFKTLYSDGITINKMANELNLAPLEIHKLVFNLFKSIDGGNQTSREKSKADLKLIK